MIYGLLCCYYYKLKALGLVLTRLQNNITIRMRSKKSWAREINLLRLLVFYINFQQLQTKGWNSWTQDAVDCPNKIIGCATASECCYWEYFCLCVVC